MPVIICYGLHEDDFEDQRITKLEKAIISAATKIRDLGLTSQDISFYFPRDPTITSDTIDLVIIVDFLFIKPERTLMVRQGLAQAIASAVKKLKGNNNRKIEVFVRRFNPKEEGFASIDP